MKTFRKYFYIFASSAIILFAILLVISVKTDLYSVARNIFFGLSLAYSIVVLILEINRSREEEKEKENKE